MFQKVVFTKCVVLLFALSLIVSCGNDDNGGVLTGDTLSLAIDGGAETTYAERTSNNWTGYDPYVGGQINPSGYTDIVMTSHYNSSLQFFDVALYLTTTDSVVGVPYYASAGDVIVNYYDLISGRASQNATGGSVTLTKVDGVGGFIEGIYDLTIVDSGGVNMTISGTFSATRE